MKSTITSLAALALAATAFGQGLPSYAPPVSFVAPGASAAATGDFNGDGKIDIATANGLATGSHGVSILLSNGDGTFQAAANFFTGSDPALIAVGDFNGDGKLDVAAANTASSTLSILLGNGDGTLQAATTVALAGSPNFITARDLNADGRQDLVLTMGSGATALAGILLSNGDGTFSQSTFPAPRVVVADFNGDGRPDICIYGLGVGPDAAIKFGNGDGTFTDAPVPFTTGLPFGANTAVAGDFNNDGKVDLFGEFLAFSGRGGWSHQTYTALGNGDGTFSVNTIGLFSNGIGGANLLVGDFNRDGLLDVAGVLETGSFGATGPTMIKVLYGVGGGALSGPLKFAAGPLTGFFTGSPLVSGDFDGNGGTDFAWAAGAGINVVRNASGNPPLLSNLTVTGGTIIGGTTSVAGTVSIGSAAPAGGAVIALSSSDPAAAFFPGGPTVTIPAGFTSANFNIATAAVAAAETITITASWNGVLQTASFKTVAPFQITSVTIAPASLVGYFGGGNDALGTITFSGPVSDGTTVSFTSSNPALLRAFPQGGTATVVAGASVAYFSVNTVTNVAANTLVTITASVSVNGLVQGAPVSAPATVTTGTDTVRITKAEYVVKTGIGSIEGSSNGGAAFVRVLTPAGQQLVTLTPQNNGTFKGQFFAVAPFTSVVLQSNLGGITQSAVSQK